MMDGVRLATRLLPGCALALLIAEVLYYAARETIRNAARYGRDGDGSRPLHLTANP